MSYMFTEYQGVISWDLPHGHAGYTKSEWIVRDEHGNLRCSTPKGEMPIILSNWTII